MSSTNGSTVTLMADQRGASGEELGVYVTSSRPDDLAASEKLSQPHWFDQGISVLSMYAAHSLAASTNDCWRAERFQPYVKKDLGAARVLGIKLRETMQL